MRLVLALLVSVIFAVAAEAQTTYYVGPSGNDANSCMTATSGGASAKLTIQSIVDDACPVAGDIVSIEAGTNYGEFNWTISGTMGSPITIRGVRGAQGQWNSIIDASTDFGTSGWTLDSAGVYWKTSVTFSGDPICAVFVDGKSVPIISPRFTHTVGPPFGLTSNITNLYSGYSALGDGGYASIMHRPNTDTLYALGGVKFWDAMNAMAANSVTESRLYLRFADNSTPASHSSIRVVGGTADCYDSTAPDHGFVVSADYVTIEDLEIRGAWAGVDLAASSNDVIIQDNRIVPYFTGVRNRVANVTDVSILTNTFEREDWQYDLYDPGAYSGHGGVVNECVSSCPTYVYELWMKSSLYNHGKYLFSEGQSNEFSAVMLNGSGDCSGWTISGNTIDRGSQVFMLKGGGCNSDTLEITGNTVSRFSSTGLELGINSATTFGSLEYHDNDIRDVNTPFRVQEDPQWACDWQVYYYNNRIWNPGDPAVGQHIQFNDIFTLPTADSCVDKYIYHNSIVGVSSCLDARFGGDQQGYSTTYFFNNYCQPGGGPLSRSGFEHGYAWGVYDINGANKICQQADSSGLGGWDYNWAMDDDTSTEYPHWGAGTSTYDHPDQVTYDGWIQCDWVGTNNVSDATEAFPRSGSVHTTPPTDWALPMGHTGIDAGVDVSSASLTINGDVIGAMPGYSASYWSGTGPNMGSDQGATGTAPGTSWLATDDFDSYSTATDLDTLNGGTNWNDTWDQVSGSMTIETAPAGMSGNAVRFTGTGSAVYLRGFAGITAGHFGYLFRTPASAIDGDVWVGFCDDDGLDQSLACAVPVGRLRFAGGNIQIQTDELPAGSGTWSTITTYTTSTTYQLECQFDDAMFNDQYRCRVDGGAWSAWTDTMRQYDSVDVVFIRAGAATSMTMWYDDIEPEPTASIIVSRPLGATTHLRSANVPVEWSTPGITSGNVTIEVSENGFEWFTAATVAYNSSPYSFDIDALVEGMGATTTAQVRVCQGAICDTSPAFIIRGNYGL